MKRNLLILYHGMRMTLNWNKCRRMLEDTGMTHGTLYYSNWGYAKASIRYNESRDFLVKEGQYITAQSQMKAYQKTSVA